MSTVPVTDTLSRLMASTYVLALKTHGYHWNVRGSLFPQLHSLFEEQYDGLYEAADGLAERLRALGADAPAGLAQLGELSVVTADGAVVDQMAMVRALRDDHLAVAKVAYEVIAAADAAGDPGSEDMATERVQEHEKAAWMLGAILA
ncbi:MAG: DNA starvation/stationary phase protection protein [Alphaproteobacteria bacterium]|nr:DNA starvation/stationary phase protection protein [Alphaproteobacteria bacterium]TAD88682.1 MAG: DNA starvation/stationary phase protection protein [Alphaproteobacteria bacterium]